jgi:heat shock protein HslJ
MNGLLDEGRRLGRPGKIPRRSVTCKPEFVEPAPAADGRTPPVLRFGTDSPVSGSDGCNPLTGRWTVTDGVLRFGPLATTMMACPGEIDVVARAVMAALNAAIAYRIDDGVLVLVDAEGAATARLRPAP